MTIRGSNTRNDLTVCKKDYQRQKYLKPFISVQIRLLEVAILETIYQCANKTIRGSNT